LRLAARALIDPVAFDNIPVDIRSAEYAFLHCEYCAGTDAPPQPPSPAMRLTKLLNSAQA
jgi:hypothetical protein